MLGVTGLGRGGGGTVLDGLYGLVLGTIVLSPYLLRWQQELVVYKTASCGGN
ncbi:hypothetical protein GXW82_08705 [Streptacidiphilus sp. 4-A2]|nr:hypothetical protein [Streptacidiphilus sp. 4-A2]